MAALDSIVPVAKQREWLVNPVDLEANVERSQPADPIEYRDRLALIAASPRWRETGMFLQRFIPRCLIEFVKTERIWWSVTIGPGGDFVRLNVGPQELITISPWDDFHAHILVDQTLAASINETWYSTCSASIEPSPYSTVPNQVMIKTENPQLLASFLSNPTAVLSAKTLSLALMRARRNVWGRSHSSELISLLLNYDFNSARYRRDNNDAAFENLSPSVRSEIERTVWLRQNTTRFSAPVKQAWGGKCALTGIWTDVALEACHIKPWKDSSETEKYDVDNGLCLAAHVHKCFDANLICIKQDGTVEISDLIAEDDRVRIGICVSQIRLNRRQAMYFSERYRLLSGTNEVI